MRTASITLAGALALVVAGCGGGSTGSAGPSSPSPTPSGGSSTATVTVANNAVTPRTITVTRGSRLTFVNNDNQVHDIESNPHPAHTDCPEINQVGFVSPGQSRQTGVLNNARTCGYHDHLNDAATSMQGTITIQ
jgi:plastocyanin